MVKFLKAIKLKDQEDSLLKSSVLQFCKDQNK